MWNKKGFALRALGKYDQAIECYNKAIEIEPEKPAIRKQQRYMSSLFGKR